MWLLCCVCFALFVLLLFCCNGGICVFSGVVGVGVVALVVGFCC